MEGLKIFGIEHFVYLLIMGVIFIPLLICSKKYVKEEKKQIIVIKSLGALLLISIVCSRLAITFNTDNPRYANLFPNSFCAMSSLVLSLSVLIGKKDNNVLHFVWFIALVGGIITMVYPDFLPQDASIFYPQTITGLLHHTLSIVVVVAVLMFGYIKVTYKKWYCTLFGFTCYLTFGAFLISVFNYSDAFHIMKPILSGTPLTAWVMAPIYIFIYGLVLFIVEIVRKKKKNK